MARKPRVHFAGALYHVMSRGNQGQSIFRDDRDRERYLEFLKESQARFGYRLYAYVLMESRSPFDPDGPEAAVEGDAKHIVSLHPLLEPAVQKDGAFIPGPF